MEYKKHNCNSYNIHTIRSDKFKTVRIEIMFRREVKLDEMPKFTFLCDLLTDTCKKYKSRREIAVKLEELYKSVFYGSTNKVGNLFTISFVMDFISPIYINDAEYLESVIKFPIEALNNPNVEMREFDVARFNIVKRRILEEIAQIKENSSKLAIYNALVQMDNGSPSSYRVIGTKEQIEEITPSNLYECYEDLFNHSLCDIFVIGNADMEKVVKIIKDNFKNKVIKMKKHSIDVDNKSRKKPLECSDNSNFIQSNLVMIYNIENLSSYAKTIDFHVFNYLLGTGGISSKLYKNLRTDNSLCYGVKSLYLKYDGLLIIQVSLDEKNLSLAKKLIKKSLTEMIKGDFSDSDLEDAKKNLVFSLKTSEDNNVSVLNNYIFHEFADMPLIEERIKMIKEVKKEDVTKCARALKLNTEYVLRGSGE